MKRTVINTNQAPGAIGPYSQAIQANGFLFISGQIPLNPETGDIPADITAQTRQSLENVKAIAAAAEKRTPRRKNVMGKIYYGAQVSVQPPTIVLFVNKPEAFTKHYTRFLTNHFRKHLPFHEIPIQIYYRPRKRDEK